MEAFWSEIENPIVQKDIIELEKKIFEYNNGKLDEDKFRSLRLARGVYGQRQQGVQMIRIKIPYGKLTFNQLNRIADVSDEYSRGKLHITTRQDIQIHYVSLERTPELWSELEKDEVTLREACGNVVRNITSSSFAGIDTEELFDVRSYAHALFEYLLRNPVGQELGRKIKISFSSSEKDTAYSFIHDLGFIPKIKNGVKGFKILVGGGLGAQAMLAKIAYEFLPASKLLSFTEAVIRVFDRYGERNKRNKARLKFLIKDIGLDQFLNLVNEFLISVPEVKLVLKDVSVTKIQKFNPVLVDKVKNVDLYDTWLKTNVFRQKQNGFFAIGIKLRNGDISTKKVRILNDIVQLYGNKEIRLTIDQNILIPNVRLEYVEAIFNRLEEIKLTDIGFNSVADITACPGTDTCNLGITNTSTLSQVLEDVILNDFNDLIKNNDIKIKISGCMNSCGQHGIANIGFHGSTIKLEGNVAPAVQVLIGGGIVGNGKGRIADKVVKVPTRKAPDVLRLILNDYEINSENGEYFNDYYDRAGKDYFYQLFKPINQDLIVNKSLFVDWNSDVKFETKIGVGECAGVMIDLVSTLLFEAQEKLENSENYLKENKFSDSIFESYNSLINSAKAILIKQQIKTNTSNKIINEFEEKIIKNGIIKTESFIDLANEINKQKPTKEFAISYLSKAKKFNKILSEYNSAKKTLL